ncbi:MAG TPA: hypothetical protein VK003_05165 [Oceanobacillus sp.]|nr:hypothetical protein [Oceanobacillus sp.]
MGTIVLLSAQHQFSSSKCAVWAALSKRCGGTVVCSAISGIVEHKLEQPYEPCLAPNRQVLPCSYINRLYNWWKYLLLFCLAA